MQRRLLAATPATILALFLGACSFFFPEVGGPGPISSGEPSAGANSTTLIITTEQVGCCYMEGSLHFGRLEGPMVLELEVDDGSGAGADGNRFEVGRQVLIVEPGAYTLTEWEQVCDGNCDNRGAPTNHCSIDLNAGVGETLEILVTFPLGEPCVATLG